jgi:hypothetical protein
MGWACGPDGREMHSGFFFGSPRQEDHLEDIGVDGRIILK